MTDESFLQVLTRKFGVICIHYFNFDLKVNHFISKSSSYRELIKVTAPFKPVHICLIKSIDRVVCKLKKIVAPLRFALALTLTFTWRAIRKLPLLNSVVAYRKALLEALN